MQALLESERQRAKECEKKYTEAQETIKIMRTEETERKVLQLQEYDRFYLFHNKFVLYMYIVDINIFHISSRSVI